MSLNHKNSFHMNEKVNEPLINDQSFESNAARQLKLVPQAPLVKDKFGLIYIVFILFGIALLLPFNVFINAKDVNK